MFFAHAAGASDPCLQYVVLADISISQWLAAKATARIPLHVCSRYMRSMPPSGRSSHAGRVARRKQSDLRHERIVTGQQQAASDDAHNPATEFDLRDIGASDGASGNT